MMGREVLLGGFPELVGIFVDEIEFTSSFSSVVTNSNFYY